jgi:hypothetical protein
VQTQNVVAQFQEIQLTLNKSKETYHNLCVEFDKAKRQLDATQLASYQQLSQQQVSASNLMSLLNNNNNANNASNNNGINQNGVGALMTASSNGMGMGQNTSGLSQNLSVGQQLSNSVNVSSGSGGSGGSTGGGGPSMPQSTNAAQPQASSGATDRFASLATSITANRVTQLLKLEKKVHIYVIGQTTQ